MAIEAYSFPVTIPAGTMVANPHVASLATPPRTVQRIEWKVPPGPRGVMGFAIGMAGTHLFPQGQGAWIVTDDEENSWEVSDQPDSGAWECYGYNTGGFDHTVYLRFLVGLPPSPGGSGSRLIPSSLLSGG